MKIKRLNIMEEKYHSSIELYALLGLDNPTGSIKDVTVRQMLLAYQKEGKLKEGSTIIEATSGNTGISLAYYHSLFHYRCVIIMPESMSVERRNMIAQYGAELVLLKGGMAECEAYAEVLAQKTSQSFVFSQFDSPFNSLAHYQVTGPFIQENLPQVDYLFAGIGTGGTISGTGKYLKEQNPACQVIGIEPLESPLLTKGIAHSHLIQGIGANFIPKALNQSILNDVIDINGEEAIAMAKEIRSEEKIDIGISSGASFLGALTYFKKHHQPTKEKALIIFPDKGDRYSW